LLGDDVVAERNALIADVDGGAGDELLHLLLRFPAKGAAQVPIRVFSASIQGAPTGGSSPLRPRERSFFRIRSEILDFACPPRKRCARLLGPGLFLRLLVLGCVAWPDPVRRVR